MKQTRLLTGAGAAILVASAVFGFGCQSVPTPAQRASFAALNQAWPSVRDMADRGAQDMLEDGEVNEAGKSVLDARTEAFGQLLADLLSGGAQ